MFNKSKIEQLERRVNSLEHELKIVAEHVYNLRELLMIENGRSTIHGPTYVPVSMSTLLQHLGLSVKVTKAETVLVKTKK
jgi:hypothetical protein